jgi:Pyruvate phosphate dikinase, AMP/ATP-binding domain
VLKSWSSERAATYRRLNKIPDGIGTAITVQAMVFGNLGPRSGSGVGFTRDPANGRNEFFVDYLPNAQGEDVVSGRRKALGIADLERRVPQAYRDLAAARELLEREFRDMQDFEFTVEDGKLFFLQSRAGKRTPLAALRIAHDLAEEGLITPADALALLKDIDLDTIAEERIETREGAVALVTGIPAGSGVAAEAAIFSASRPQSSSSAANLTFSSARPRRPRISMLLPMQQASSLWKARARRMPQWSRASWGGLASWDVVQSSFRRLPKQLRLETSSLLRATLYRWTVQLVRSMRA